MYYNVLTKKDGDDKIHKYRTMGSAVQLIVLFFI